jgi:hypothetical protein
MISPTRPKRNATIRLLWRGKQQGPLCVGFSGEGWQRSTPSLRGLVTLDASGYYMGAQKYDEWAGEGYDGSSVRGLMKFMQAHPDVDLNSYYFAATTNAIMAWFNQEEHPVTPPIIGVNWYSSMWHPDSAGKIEVTGWVDGGHALLVIGYFHDKKGQLYWWLHNSWGREWGIEGRAYLRDEDLQRLLQEDGECALGTKFPKTP